MQQLQMQKDKLELIEWITQLNDENVLLRLREIKAHEEVSGFTLTQEQKLILKEGTAKYESGEEPGYTWEEVLEHIEIVRKSIHEKKA